MAMGWSTEIWLGRVGLVTSKRKQNSRWRPGVGLQFLNRESINMPSNVCPYLRQISTDFHNSFTGTPCGKSAITSLLTIPPHFNWSLQSLSEAESFIVIRPPVRSNGRTYKMLVMFFFLSFFLSFFSPTVLRAPSIDRPETLPHDRNLQTDQGYLAHTHTGTGVPPKKKN